MISHSRNLQKIAIFFLASCVFLFSGCAPSLRLVRDNFYTYETLSAEINTLSLEHRDVVDIEEIGKTHEGRLIFVIKISGRSLQNRSKPALMAIFAEHSGEHDVTSLAMGFTEYLVENYGRHKRVTRLLSEKEVYIVPMMNPDGVEYDLSGEGKPFTWRKNRRPTGKETYGVNLNRNWGKKWEAPVPEKLVKDLRNKKSDSYAGERPFSEKETQAIRDFILSHPNIKMFVDYHSGFAPFLQGGVGFPIPRSEDQDLPPGHRRKYEEVAEEFARVVSNPKDNRPGFVVSKERDVAKVIRSYAPWYIRFFIPKNIPPTPGTSGEWVYGELGIMVLGVEIFRSRDFFNRLPESKEELIQNQIRGFLFLVDTVTDDAFQ